MSQHYKTDGHKIPIFVQESAGSDSGGFTLIEIMVVISLLSLMIVFSFPKFSAFLSINNKNKLVRWMIVQRTVLNTKAKKEQIPYVLRVDISNNRLMAMPLRDTNPTDEEGSPSDDADLTGHRQPDTFICSGDLQVVGVVFPGGETIISQTADIGFSEKGYCDRAIIQMKEGGNRFSIYIEPFLPRISLYDGYIKFGQQWEKMS